MGFESYFLILSDLTTYAKNNNICTSPRGYLAGSMVAYVLGISDICPLKFGLLFDLLLNQEHRQTLALDVDIADTGEDKIMEYAIDKYGREKCSQIISSGMNKRDGQPIKLLWFSWLSCIGDCQMLIQKKNPSFDIDKIALEDAKTYEAISLGKTLGVFQLESSFMINDLRRLNLENIEDIAAAIVLYRPATENLIDDFIARKHNLKESAYLHPLLEPILKDAYGIVIYREQVMKISIELADFTPAKANALIKAMREKNESEILSSRKNFAAGAKKKGIGEDLADKIFDSIESFGGVTFSKAHAISYAVLAYKTAYLKTNYPQEYLAAIAKRQESHYQYKVGLMYYRVDGIDENKQEAVKQFEKAAKQGNTSAQDFLRKLDEKGCNAQNAGQ